MLDAELDLMTRHNVAEDSGGDVTAKLNNEVCQAMIESCFISYIPTMSVYIYCLLLISPHVIQISYRLHEE